MFSLWIFKQVCTFESATSICGLTHASLITGPLREGLDGLVFSPGVAWLCFTWSVILQQQTWACYPSRGRTQREVKHAKPLDLLKSGKTSLSLCSTASHKYSTDPRGEEKEFPFWWKYLLIRIKLQRMYIGRGMEVREQYCNQSAIEFEHGTLFFSHNVF